MERTIGAIAACVAILIVLLLPGTYFLVGYQSQRAILVTETEINARLVSAMINANPELWAVETLRLESLLKRRPRDGHKEIRAVFDLTHQLVAEVRDELDAPLIEQSIGVQDAGREVGNLQIARSLRPLIVGSALMTLLGILLALGVFVTLKVLPLRALRMAFAALVDERERSNAALREKDAAQAAGKAKAQFLANMSHEIRTPLNGVLGMTEILLGTELDDKQRKMAQTAYRAGESLLRLINDILDFSKIEAGMMELERLTFDLPELAEDVAALLAPRAHEKGIELLCDIDAAVPACVVGDSGRLRQILTNLLGNAVKFTERGEVALKVDLESAGDGAAWLMFSVRDTGAGIDAKMLPRLFQMFSQADESMSRRYGGTGLGLAISRQLLEIMGGTVTAESKLGVGSIFRCRVPLTLGAPESLPVKPVALDALHGRRVLVIEDNATNRRILENQLHAVGIQAHCAKNGIEGLAALREAVARGQAFEAAVLDMKLPDFSGVAVAQAVRGDPALAATRLLMLTSQCAGGEAQAAASAGVDVYLTKPARRGELHAALARVFGQKPVVMAEVATAAPKSKTGRVLLAEDNLVNQAVALGILEHAGYTVRTAADGIEALQALSEEGFDLVLMDCQMPEMDGFAATAAIRGSEAADPVNAHLPIIALTANAMAGDRENCLAAGFDDYLAKPFKRQEILAMVEKWNQQRGAIQPTREPGILVAAPSAASPRTPEQASAS